MIISPTGLKIRLVGSRSFTLATSSSPWRAVHLVLRCCPFAFLRRVHLLRFKTRFVSSLCSIAMSQPRPRRTAATTKIHVARSKPSSSTAPAHTYHVVNAPGQRRHYSATQIARPPPVAPSHQPDDTDSDEPPPATATATPPVQQPRPSKRKSRHKTRVVSYPAATPYVPDIVYSNVRSIGCRCAMSTSMNSYGTMVLAATSTASVVPRVLPTPKLACIDVAIAWVAS